MNTTATLFYLSTIVLTPTACAFGVAFLIYAFVVVRATLQLPTLDNSEDVGNAVDDVFHGMRAMLITLIIILTLVWLSYCCYHGLFTAECPGGCR